MGYKWHSTNFKGVRYREHKARKHGIMKDRYYVIRYQQTVGEGDDLKKVRREEKLGWASKGGWTPEKAALELAKLKQAATLGEGPTRLHEKREKAQKEKERKEAENRQHERDSVTFSQFFNDTYFPVAQTRKKPGTFEKELQHFNLWLKPILGEMPIRAITEIHLQKIIKAMSDKNLSVRYKEYVLSTFRVVWKMARDRKLVVGSYPGNKDKIKLPKVENGRLRYLTPDEAESLLEELDKWNTDMHDMTLLSLHTGARAKEVFQLTWGCVDEKQGMILFKDTKNSKNRYAYMTAEVQRLFKNRRRGAGNQRIFKNGYGKEIKETPETFRTVVKKLGLNDGVDDPRQRVVFHTCRHTFGSWHAQRGTPPNVLKELMGHSTIKVTEKYSHVSADHLRHAMAGFEDSIKTADVAKVVPLAVNDKE
jgi:integrase